MHHYHLQLKSQSFEYHHRTSPRNKKSKTQPSTGKHIPLENAHSQFSGTKEASLTHCHWATQKCVITLPCIVDGSRISTFFLHDVLHICLSCGLVHLSLQGYRQLDAGCLGLKLQINRPVTTPYFQNHYTPTTGPLIQIPSLFSFSCNHGFV